MRAPLDMLMCWNCQYADQRAFPVSFLSFLFVNNCFAHLANRAPERPKRHSKMTIFNIIMEVCTLQHLIAQTNTYQDVRKGGGLCLRAVAFMMVLVVLVVGSVEHLALLVLIIQNSVPRGNHDGFGGFGVFFGGFGRDTYPLKLNSTPLFRHCDYCNFVHCGTPEPLMSTPLTAVIVL